MKLLLDEKEQIYLITGRITKIEKKEIEKNDKKYYITTGSVDVDSTKERNDNNRYVNIKALFGKAKMLQDIIKGDYILIVARKEDREYNNKTYTDYIIDFCVRSSGQSEEVPLGATPTTITPVKDEDLPF